MIRFTPNRNAPNELARAAEMQRFLGNVADAAATEAQSRLPYPQILGGIEISGTADGNEAAVVISGSGWHLWEYGTVNHPPKPAVRPGVQSVIERFGGRFKSQ